MSVGAARASGAVSMVLCVLTATAWVNAQSAADIASRRGLLTDAETARASGDHARALDLALRAARITESPSVRMFIATEQNEVGLYVDALDSAMQCVREANTDPSLHNRDAILATCSSLRDALGARIGRIRIRVPAPTPPGLVVRLNGQALAPSSWGEPVAMNPGVARVEAHAPGVPDDLESVHVDAGRVVEVTLVLGHPESHPAASADNSGVPIAPIVVMGAGVLALGASAVFGILMRDASVNTLTTQCPMMYCAESDPNGPLHTAYRNAQTYALVGDVTLAVGAVALAGGAAWFFLARPHARGSEHARVHVGPWIGGAGLVVGGEL